MFHKFADLFPLWQSISRLNRARRWHSRSSRLSKSIAAQSMVQGAPARSEVARVLSLLTPYDCGMPLKRIGPRYDGGYLIPDDLAGIEASFSPGVAETLGFDLEIARTGIPTHLADASVPQPANMAPNMSFTDAFIGAENSAPFITMDAWVGKFSPGSGDLLLQMDIEGAEYDVISAIEPTMLERFRIIVIEFHGLDRILDPDFHRELDSALSKLNRNHVPCHFHPNNAAPYFQLFGQTLPQVFEVTYIRRDRRKDDSMAVAPLPHPLDEPNVADIPNPAVSNFWAMT